MQRRPEHNQIADGLRVLERAASLICPCESFDAACEAYSELLGLSELMTEAERERIDLSYACILAHRLSCGNSATSDENWSRGSGSRANPDAVRSESDSVRDHESATPRRRSRPVKLVDFHPIRVSGGPLSEDIIRDRR